LHFSFSFPLYNSLSLSLFLFITPIAIYSLMWLFIRFCQ
jgi:hypothetical protein